GHMAAVVWSSPAVSDGSCFRRRAQRVFRRGTSKVRAGFVAKGVTRGRSLIEVGAGHIIGAGQGKRTSAMPKLSIGIPVFNGQEFLPELLDCMLAQTFKDFEILICDNASSDRTSEVCCQYERRDS